MKKRLIAMIGSLCLLAVLLSTSLTSLAEEAPKILPLTVGTEKTGTLAADALSGPDESGPTTEYTLAARVPLEQGRLYQLETTFTVPEQGVSAAMLLLFSTEWLDDGQPDEDTVAPIGATIGMVQDEDTLHMPYSFVVETAGDYLLACVLTVPQEIASGEYSLLVADKGKAEALEPAWDETALNGDGAVAAAPDGTLYVANAYSERDLADPEADETALAGLDDGYYLIAFNPADGTEKWRFELAMPSDGTPLVGPDGTIYIGTYADEAGTATVYAVKPDGSRKWMREITADDMDMANFRFSSALYEGKLIIKADSGLLALNAATGDTLWQAEANLGNAAYCNPVIAGGHVYVAAWEEGDLPAGVLLAYDLQTGDQVFRLDDMGIGPNQCVMAADQDGTLYFIGNEQIRLGQPDLPEATLYAVKPDGTVKWSVTTGLFNLDQYPLLVSDGVIYAAGANEDLTGYCLLTFDATTGEELDRVNVPYLRGSLSGMVLADNGDLYISAGNGLFCLREDGSYAYFTFPLVNTEGAVTPMLLTKDGKLCLSYYTFGSDETGNTLSGSRLLCFDVGTGYADGWSMYFANPARQNTFTGNYKVTFESNGGSAVVPQWLDLNAAVAKPADPTKNGARFAGWYTDKELTRAYDFSAKVTNSFTLYAKWETVTTAAPITTAPTTTTKPTSTPTKADTGKSPDTGASHSMVGFFALLTVAGAALALASRKKRG